MKITQIEIEYVDFIPNELKEGVLYISNDYNISKHKCFCGCGNDVVLDLNRWTHSGQSGPHTISVSPSIGSFNLECKSHYFIKNNIIEWC